MKYMDDYGRLRGFQGGWIEKKKKKAEKEADTYNQVTFHPIVICRFLGYESLLFVVCWF